MRTRSSVPLQLSWRKPAVLLLFAAATSTVFFTTGSVHSGRSRFPSQTCYVSVDDTSRGQELRHVSPEYSYSVLLPRQWKGRAHVMNAALQSCGFTPEFSLLSPVPEEEVVVAVKPLSPDRSLEDEVERWKADGSTVMPVEIGSRPGYRFRTSDGREVVTTSYNGRQYEIILQPADASKTVRRQYERALRTFRFGEFI